VLEEEGIEPFGIVGDEEEGNEDEGQREDLDRDVIAEIQCCDIGHYGKTDKCA